MAIAELLLSPDFGRLAQGAVSVLRPLTGKFHFSLKLGYRLCNPGRLLPRSYSRANGERTSGKHSFRGFLNVVVHHAIGCTIVFVGRILRQFSERVNTFGKLHLNGSRIGQILMDQADSYRISPLNCLREDILLEFHLLRERVWTKVMCCGFAKLCCPNPK